MPLSQCLSTNSGVLDYFVQAPLDSEHLEDKTALVMFVIPVSDKLLAEKLKCLMKEELNE